MDNAITWLICGFVGCADGYQLLDITHHHSVLFQPIKHHQQLEVCRGSHAIVADFPMLRHCSDQFRIVSNASLPLVQRQLDQIPINFSAASLTIASAASCTCSLRPRSTSVVVVYSFTPTAAAAGGGASSAAAGGRRR